MQGSLTWGLTVLVSQSSSWPDTGNGRRVTVSVTLPERPVPVGAAAEHTKEVPLGLQASDRILETHTHTHTSGLRHYA